MRKKRSAYDRLMDKVRVCEETGCWLFEGARDQNGHGNVFVATVDGRDVYDKAHRIAYREHHGPIPEGHVVRHKCDTANCVAPHDLETGTQLMNVQDMIDRNRCRRDERGCFTSLADATTFCGASML